MQVRQITPTHTTTNTKQSSNWLACLQQWAGLGWRSLRSLLLQNTQRITSSDRITTIESSQVRWYWFQDMARPQTIHKIQQTKAIPIVPRTSIQNTNDSNPVKLAINPWFQWVSELLTLHSVFTTTLVDWGQFHTTENLQTSEPFIHGQVHISIKYGKV